MTAEPKSPFRKNYTPEQLRSFRLRVLAQMLYFESIGLGMTQATARKQAIAALDIPQQDKGESFTAERLIGELFAAADEALKPAKADDMERTL